VAVGVQATYCRRFRRLPRSGVVWRRRRRRSETYFAARTLMLIAKMVLTVISLFVCVLCLTESVKQTKSGLPARMAA
jgi:hypothetical protein